MATSCCVRHEELGDLLRRSGGTPALEPLVGDPVERRHRRSDVLAGGRDVVVDADPHVEGVEPVRHDATGVRRGDRHRLDRLGVAGGGHPDAEPAVAEPAGPPDRRVGAAADDDGDRYRRGGDDLGALQREERAVEVDRLAGEQLPDDLQCLVHPPATGCRIDAADLHLVAILATDADAEHEPARRQRGDIGKLPGDGHGCRNGSRYTAVFADIRSATDEDPGGAEQPVEPGADDEADVIAHRQVVQPSLLGELDQGDAGGRVEQAHARKDAADADGGHGRRLSRRP